MTRQYLVGEFSARLEQLQAVTSRPAVRQVAELRYEVESCPSAWLPVAMKRAIVLADGLCWDSLSRGDATSFARQAAVSAGLRLFGMSARLLEES